MPLAQSADSEQAAWRKRIAIRPKETAQGRKTWRKGAIRGAGQARRRKTHARAQAKAMAQDARHGARRRKAA